MYWRASHLEINAAVSHFLPWCINLFLGLYLVTTKTTMMQKKKQSKGGGISTLMKREEGLRKLMGEIRTQDLWYTKCVIY